MLGAQEKTPAEAGAGKACLLSHIKAPAQGGKAGSSELLADEYSKSAQTGQCAATR